MDVAGTLELKQLELMAKGYSIDQAQMATMRAAKWAGSMADKVPAEGRDAAFSGLLSDQLETCEHWLEGLDSAAARGDHAKGVARAARDDRLAEGLDKVGLEVGPQTKAAWEDSLDEGSRAWATKMRRHP